MYNRCIPTEKCWMFLYMKIKTIKKLVRHLRCKLDGHDFEGDNNKSGCCTIYLQKLGIENAKYECKHNFDKYFEMITEEKDFLCCPYCDYSTVDSTNKSGVFTVHLKKEHNITPDILIKEYPEYADLYPTFLWREGNKKLNEEVGITCAVCGKKFRKLTRTHLKSHGLTPTQYKLKYGVRTTCSEHTENLQRNAGFRTQIDQVFARIEYAGLTPLFTKDEYKGVVGYTYKFKCNKCGHIFEGSLDCGESPICRICHPKQELEPNHKIEHEIQNFLFNECGITNLIINDRTILRPKEIDFVIPDKKIGIEINGLYWHSEEYGKNEKYHINKTLEAYKKGYQLIHIFEDEWYYKKYIITEKLKYILKLNTNTKIYAKNCNIKEITSEEKRSFLNRYHIQGDDYYSYLMLGLFNNNNLVSVMTFCPQRKVLNNKKSENDTVELLRYASNNVVGGFEKLLKYAIEYKLKPNGIKHIFSFANLRFTNIDKNIYVNSGFKFLGISDPTYFYTKQTKRYSRLYFNKESLIKEGFSSDLTIDEILKQKGYSKIYDCGNLKYILDI